MINNEAGLPIAAMNREEAREFVWDFLSIGLKSTGYIPNPGLTLINDMGRFEGHLLKAFGIFGGLDLVAEVEDEQIVALAPRITSEAAGLIQVMNQARKGNWEPVSLWLNEFAMQVEVGVLNGGSFQELKMLPALNFYHLAELVSSEA